MARLKIRQTKRFLMLFGEKGWVDRIKLTIAETITSQTSHDDEESIENCLQSYKIRSNLYKKYKKETGHEPWQLSDVIKHFTRNSFRWN
ncbi:hypothetical protein GLOIN_2v1880093 [Rhizophagus irregularis DAOM 181602=DAOM 197198]|nr:hypothetical protein GLOIN_2v1880093 [Rhizophagus irregularis DAOM 181602=DAOM 197198]